MLSELDQEQMLTYGMSNEEDGGNNVDDTSGFVKLRVGRWTSGLVVNCEIDRIEPPSVLLAVWLLMLSMWH
jgi:hypothetical protein